MISDGLHVTVAKPIPIDIENNLDSNSSFKKKKKIKNEKRTWEDI